MKRVESISRIRIWVAAAGLGLAFGAWPPVAAQALEYVDQPVIGHRDPVPGSDGLMYVLYGLSCLDDAGNLTFRAGLEDDRAQEHAYGLFRAVRGEARPAVLLGDAAPGGGYFADFSLPVCSDPGEVAFSALVVDESVGAWVGVFSLVDDALRLLVRSGDPIPGTPLALEGFGDLALANDGRLAFVGDTASGEGIFRLDDGVPVPLVWSGDPVPRAPGTSFHSFGYSRGGEHALALSTTGEVAFLAPFWFRGDPISVRAGVFRVSGGAIESVALADSAFAPGDPIPGTDGGYNHFTDVALSDRGDLAFAFRGHAGFLGLEGIAFNLGAPDQLLLHATPERPFDRYYGVALNALGDLAYGDWVEGIKLRLADSGETVLVAPGCCGGRFDLAGSRRLVRYARGHTLYSPLPEVEIDIRPGSDVNPVQLAARGSLPVAILGAASFDVEDVDGATLAFGPAGAAPQQGSHGSPEDVNGDGWADLVLHFAIPDSGIELGDDHACLRGETRDALPFEACDAIETRAAPRAGAGPRGSR